MKNIFLTFILSLSILGQATAQSSNLQRQGTATQLTVDGKPFLILKVLIFNLKWYSTHFIILFMSYEILQNGNIY